LTYTREKSKIGANFDAPASRSCHIRAVALSVLIVDDDAGFRRRARRLLSAAGYAVAGEAADGASALAGVRELRPDVLLLDILLPDIDGIEVAGRLAAESDGGPAVVLTSSRDAADYGRRLRDAATAGFIPKADLSPAALAAVLRAER
jgi:DNA-binding NarL/FixJ family response regulator